MAQVPGFYGKLPSRGDFLTSGLGRAFVDAWTEWMDQGLRASQEALGAEWVPAWMEAPLWFFTLAPGLGGPTAAAGFFFPSVDRAGRHYPMTVVTLFPGLSGPPDAMTLDPWLRDCTVPALAALYDDWAPDALAEALGKLPAPSVSVSASGRFWSDGGPRVAATSLEAGTLLMPAAFTRLLQAEADTEPPLI
ncbi:MAG TPA: type VI secretion system-associated protein TagF [Stellaceae bacterium]|nr:type VI secretion system-associated protein TagF [Stellaceae bacterium]